MMEIAVLLGYVAIQLGVLYLLGRFVRKQWVMAVAYIVVMLSVVWVYGIIRDPNHWGIWG